MTFQKRIAIVAFLGVGLACFGQTNQNPIDTTLFTVVEQMPDFPGNKDAMFKFISKSIHWKADSNCSGKVYIEFIVEKDGKLTNIKCKRGIAGCPDLTDEAIRVTRSMPKWTIGKQNGKASRVIMMIPIKFEVK